jgi:hypothetical protein
MARTTRKRQRKHRGSQTGRIEARGRTSRPKKSQKKGGGKRRPTGPERHDRPPTWRSAINRGVFAAAIFFALMLLLLGRTVPQALALAAFMLAFYIPLGYMTDSFFHKRRKRQLAKQRELAKAERGGK